MSPIELLWTAKKGKEAEFVFSWNQTCQWECDGNGGNEKQMLASSIRVRPDQYLSPQQPHIERLAIRVGILINCSFNPNLGIGLQFAFSQLTNLKSSEKNQPLLSSFSTWENLIVKEFAQCLIYFHH